MTLIPATIAALVLQARAAHAPLVASMPHEIQNDRQRELAAKHGTPREFAQACVDAIGDISTDEARAAIFRYQTAWLKA